MEVGDGRTMGQLGASKEVFDRFVKGDFLDK